MARVLYAWEIGNGMGHITNMLPTACQLAARGHSVHLCVRHVTFAQQLLRKAGLSYSQAPYWSGFSNSVNPASYSEILLGCGYGNANDLSNTLEAWRRCLSTHNPDLLIADHAPTALLAARVLGIPTAQIGSGFFSPPRVCPLPIFRNWEEVDARRVSGSEDLVLRQINSALERLGNSSLSAVSDLFMGIGRDLLCTWKELDAYPERSPTDYYGPVFAADIGQGPKWVKRNGCRVFLYLKPDYPYIHELVKGLRESTLNGLAYIPGGVPKSLLDEWPSNVTVYAKPVRLGHALTQADAVVCHGGPATIAAGLLAGKPLLLLPMQAEQMVNSRQASALGAAMTVAPELAPTNMSETMHKFLNGQQLFVAAQNFALQHQDFDSATQTAQMTQILEQLI